MLQLFPALGLTVAVVLSLDCRADVDSLRTEVAKVLEQHGIVGNAAMERRGTVAASTTLTPGSSAQDPLTGVPDSRGDFALRPRLPGEDTPANPSADVTGVVIHFLDKDLAARAAANLPPPDEVVAGIEGIAPGNLHYERPMSLGRYVFRLARGISQGEYEAMAVQIRDLPGVESVSADIRMQAKLVPDDPYFRYQWSLMNTGDYSDLTMSYIIGMNAVAAWDLLSDSHPITVAVLDTGMTKPSPIPAARVLPGFDFISDPDSARDGDGWDEDPNDEGDYRAENECERKTDQRASTWHGAQMASLIAASGNDDADIAGIDWQAHILPVRVLGKCGGIASDIIDGMLWAAGLEVPGAPVNEYPARILNMSLGAVDEGGCSLLYQIAFAVLRSRDVVVVAGAGNESTEAALNAPSGCDGTIAVSAVDHYGELASYSNWSNQGAIDIAAPGGDWQRHPIDSSLVATSDRGEQGPTGEAFVDWTSGTSAATAHVSGALSLAMRLDPLQHTDLLVALLLETAQPFGVESSCEREYPRCGAGIVDLEALIQGTLVFKDYAVVRDFYHAGINHYFRSGNWDEVSLILNGNFGDWQEDDDRFLAWRDGSTIGSHPVCRFYGTPGVGPNSHFYTVDQDECEFVKANDPGWTYEGTAFYAKKKNSLGGCPRNTKRLYRYYNQLAHLNDSNHRYTTSLADREQMETNGWAMEGVAMCVPE